MRKIIPFEGLKADYQKPNCVFTSRKTYNRREHRIKNVPCFNFSCDKCRPILKNYLFYNTIIAAAIFSLDKHLVLTSEGKEFRETHNYQESYKLMQNSWNKFKKVVQYKYGHFDYVRFPRAQKDGYCHNHILLNGKRLPHKFLDTKRKKYPNMGFVSIQKNNNIAEYLTNDFWKDHEYYIPYGLKHFTGSEQVRKYLAVNFYKDPDSTFFQLKNCDKRIVDQYYDIVNEISGYPPPIDTLTAEFYGEIRRIDRGIQ